jgi:large subunit ribosomal protein L19
MATDLMSVVEATQFRDDLPDFSVGDTVNVHVRVVEGEKERIQQFEGTCLNRSGSGASETFTVRKVSEGVGVERIFPLHSPRIATIDVTRRGKVRRSNLSFLRDRVGKNARVQEQMQNG